MTDEDMKLRRLLAEVDRICDEAREVRERLTNSSPQPFWPDRRSHPRVFPSAHDRDNDTDDR